MKVRLWWVLPLLLGACTLAEVKVDVVSERTALENQVLGTYNALDTEMLMVASVRGVDSEGRIQTPPPRSQEQRDAILAMQVLAFHEDDLLAFKRLGWVGENREGLLTAFPLDRDGAPPELKEFAQTYKEDEFRSVIDEVNRAREATMRRVIELNDAFTEADLPEVRKVFAKLNVDAAGAGERIQGEDGSWAVKPR